jgi:hypothetical protein
MSGIIEHILVYGVWKVSNTLRTTCQFNKELIVKVKEEIFLRACSLVIHKVYGFDTVIISDFRRLIWRLLEQLAQRRAKVFLSEASCL